MADPPSAAAPPGGSIRSDLDRLWQLQLVDGALRAAEQGLAAHPHRQEAERLAREVAAREEEVRALQERLKGLRLAGRRAESELKAAEDEAAQLHQRLFGGTVTNPKELSSLQARFDATRQRVDRLQDEVLRHLFDIEEAQRSLEALTGRLQAEAARLAEAQARWEATRAQLESQAAGLRQEREALVASIANPTHRVRYERLSAAKGGQALAVVEQDRCSGCGVPLSTLLLTEARRKERMVFCEVCGRILYWPPVPPPPGPA